MNSWISAIRKITKLMTTLEELNKKSRLMKVLWRDDVSGSIAETYRALEGAIQLCEVSVLPKMTVLGSPSA